MMDEEKEYYSLIKKVFAIWASFYDFVTMPISRLRNEVANFSNARNGSKILDIVTGTGKQAFAIPAGKTEHIEFVADKQGAFHVYCSVYCGPGHGHMHASFIVK